MYVAIFLFVTF